MRKRIGYCKIGRSWNLDVRKASTVGGDIDVIRLLRRLSTKHPDIEFFLIGKNSGEVPQDVGFRDNVTNPWSDTHRWHVSSISAEAVKKDPSAYEKPTLEFRELAKDIKLDGMIMWAGQHSSSNGRIPAIGGNWIDGPFTTPLVSSVNYTGYLLDYCNTHNLEPLFLVPDPRNYIKVRDLRVDITMPALAQYNYVYNLKQDRGPDDKRGVTVSKHKYIYSALEMTALDEPHSIRFDSSYESWVERCKKPFLLISNENKREVSFPRGQLVKEWINPHFPEAEIYGTWSDAGKAEIGKDPQPIPVNTMYEKLSTALATITFPASGSQWVTSKVWECFASGIVCFIHPRYDTQGLSLPRHMNDDISQFLHLRFPMELRNRVEKLGQDYELWKKIVTAQRKFFEDRFNTTEGGTYYIEKHLNLEKERLEDDKRAS